ncbi:MAG: PEGA domain-containing protein [Hymenobacteraceae bacterium]|nr:PEGA domain-containing protein [Hymenobacteraceae bacterium]MDX5442452.1 PEGA domain-containing protein [Hymenobacteraceae bacterium]MDX5512557.1 PEGA domain-containing protein [Hymenobacteraceae bacterium]
MSLGLAYSIFLTSCASSTIIQSVPSGAKVYLNGEPVGSTPYTHTDTKIVGSTTSVKLEKEGYEPVVTSFSRDEEVDVGAVIGGLLVYVPFLWIMKYKPFHNYELKPVLESEQPPVRMQPQKQVSAKSKAERLREVKQLYDEKILSKEEYEKEKQKILSEDER